MPGEEFHIIRPDGVVERVKILSVVYGSDRKPIVRIGIDAPEDTQILREELVHERTVQNTDTQNLPSD